MSKNIFPWLLLLLLASIWGSSFILMKRGMFTLAGDPLFTDVQVAALRMTIAGTVMLPFSLYFLRKIKSWKQVLSLVLVGTCGNFLPAFLFTYAETGVSSGFAGMLNSSTPIFTIIIGYFVFKQRLSVVQFIGAGIASLGVILLMVFGKNASLDASWFHILAIVLATFFYGISLNTIKHTLHSFKSVEITALAFLMVYIPSLLIAIFSGSFHTLTTVNHAWEGFGFISILSVFGTVIALIIFNRLIALTSTLFASSVTYFIPIVAVIIGTFFKEAIGIYQVGAMIIVLLGVFVANYWHVLVPVFKKKMS